MDSRNRRLSLFLLGRTTRRQRGHRNHNGNEANLAGIHVNVPALSIKSAGPIASGTPNCP